ncbi:YjbF family lipoprotein [Thalassovita gelatinovora]|nr:YjbF family lipoprotein [Thalassovita gelatinovora]QIZ81727.1 YjbF family lipoprotein [Thalassovita gelatinovora]
MNMQSAFKRPAVLAIAALGLVAACGNAPGRVDYKSELIAAFGKKSAQTPDVDIAAALKVTPKPLSLVVREQDKTTAIILEAERNGPYRTFITSARQTLTLRQGVVTATRGIGNDLMSSDVEDTLRLLRARQPGHTRRVMRYLTGDEHTIAFSFDCTMAVGETQTINSGEISAQVRVMTEKCSGDGLQFTNTYMVDHAGEVLGSRQWINPTMGSVGIQVLRRSAV